MLRFAFIAAVLALVNTAHADEPKTYTLTLSPDETDLVWRALQDQPYRFAAPLLAKLQKQIEEQRKPDAPLPKK